jgi:hypothetical protein
LLGYAKYRSREPHGSEMLHTFVLVSLLPDTFEQVVEIDMPHPFIAGFRGGYFPSPYKCVERNEILSLSCNFSKKNM